MALERTISEPMPDSDVAIASGRLKARKSVSGSGRRTRNGSTTSRVSALGQRRRVVAVDAANGAQLLGHRVGRGRPSAGRLASARRITRSTAATAGEPVSAGGCS